MTAHNPITAGQALAMVEAVGVSDARRLIADRAAVGLVKSYALVIETEEVGGERRPVRGASMPLELWRRVIREGVADDVWTDGTVRLAASGFIGGPPEVSITGVEFERKGIDRLVKRLRGEQPQQTTRSPKPALAIEQAAEPVGSLTRSPRRPDPDAIAPGAILATINQTMAALGLGRTKVNELMKSGRLERVEIDGGVRITVASIRALAGSGS